MEIVDLISNVGFPMACVLVMGWFIKYLSDTNRKERDQTRKEYIAEVSQLRKTLEQNTLIIQSLRELLETMKGNADNARH